MTVGITVMAYEEAGGAIPDVILSNFSGDCEQDGTNSVSCRFNNDGELEASDECSINYDQDYLDSLDVPLAGIGDPFEVRCTVITGDDPNGGLLKDVWYALTTNRQFTRAENPAADKTGTWDFEVREILNISNTATATFSWSLAVGD